MAIRNPTGARLDLRRTNEIKTWLSERLLPGMTTPTTPPSPHNLLGVSHPDTAADTPTRGSLIYGNATPRWDELDHPAAANRILRTPDVNDVSWSDWNLIGTGGQTYTFGTTGGTIPTAAGTLTAATVNFISAAGVITHAITNTADGDTNVSTILRTDANGQVRVRRLGVGVAPLAADNTIALPDDGYIGVATNDLRVAFDSSAGYIKAILGDAAGADEFQIVDNGALAVASIDSDGYGYFAGHVGIGIAASASYQLAVYDAALTSTSTYFGIFNYQRKTAGASDVADIYAGTYDDIALNQVGGVTGSIYGAYHSGGLIAGTIGSVVSDQYLVGDYGYTGLTGGTLYGAAAGVRATVEQAVANTINGNIYGGLISVDADGTVSGTVYMLYLDERSNVDCGIYQSGTAPNTFGGNVTAPNHYVPDDGSVGVSGDVRTVYDSSSGYIVETLGDAAGADEWRVNDSGAVNVASIDSNGDGYFAGNVGIGAAASATYHLQVYNNALDTTATYYGIYNRHQKTAGATDENDNFYGNTNEFALNQAGGVFGYTFGNANSVQLIAGTIGTAVAGRLLAAVYTAADLDGGTIYGPVYGSYLVIDQEAANTVNGDVYGEYISVDADGTVSSLVYMLYLSAKSNVDYAIYQDGTTVNYLAGKTAIGGTTTPAAELHVDQSSSTAAIPVLLLDQADLSEEFIEFTTTVGAGNPIDTAALGAYYGKARVNVTGVGYKTIALYD